MKEPMLIRLENLVLVFNKSTEKIAFAHITYFYGQMGAGKSSIARLIDYCLGGNLDFSPALQSEFVSATLQLTLNSILLDLERNRDSDQIRASWSDKEGDYNIIIPARVGDGKVIPDTDVEVLSDLIYHLAGITPPKVRRSKLKEESDLERLSFRDLLWYCYLDQDSFDSDFFHLGEDAHIYKRLKSRDVLRFILGFHQEKVAELESELQSLHIRKLQLSEAARSLKEALDEAEVASELEIISKIDSLKKDTFQINQHLSTLRQERYKLPHGTDILREQGRNFTNEIQALEDALPEVGKKIEQDRRHKNEIVMLGIKVHRVAAARAVLGGVSFASCPRCAQKLPEREENLCLVCGQEEPIEGTANLNADVLQHDAKSRIAELEDSLKLHSEQAKRMRRRLEELLAERQKLLNELTTQMRDFDSAYLSNAIILERQQAEIGQQILNLERLIKLPQKVRELYKQANAVSADESEIRRKLEEARKGAEADTSNLKRLQELFLDCLLESKLPGFTRTNIVTIGHKDFLPEIYHPEMGDIAVTSFANLSSGGKKTLFKACFAVAIHRLAVEIGALLPSFLIIDSPMKNISERENKDQFEGFHQMIYKLATKEFLRTQIILIDKEYFVPSEELELDFSVRHMMPGNEENPPLIPYYRLM